MSGTLHDRIRPQNTEGMEGNHVSSAPVDMVTDDGTINGTTTDNAVDDGLVVLEQKRRRVEPTSPNMQPNPHSTDSVGPILPPDPPTFKGRFRFENLWLRDATCREIMIQSWSQTHGQHLMDRIGRCGKAIWSWGKNVARDFSRRIEYCQMNNTKHKRDATGILLFKEAQQ
nr:uncharacterized protein LOC109184133 isoform X2 [Ipomoea trifida]